VAQACVDVGAAIILGKRSLERAVSEFELHFLQVTILFPCDIGSVPGIPHTSAPWYYIRANLLSGNPKTH
jgi:hypothetical protein